MDNKLLYLFVLKQRFSYFLNIKMNEEDLEEDLDLFEDQLLGDKPNKNRTIFK